MAYLLDTDVVLSLLAADPVTTHLVTDLVPAGIAISAVTYMEVLQGILASADPPASEAAFEAFLADVPTLTFSPPVARRCAELRHELALKGKRVRPRALDLIVAATALHHGLTLVTRNTDDYADLPDLALY